MGMNTEFTKVKAIETTRIEPHIGETRLFRETSTITESFLMLLFGFVMSSEIAVSMVKLLSKKISEREFTAKPCRVPCPSCRYFSNSAHLRCAVNPTVTMTREAIHCPDYTPL